MAATNPVGIQTSIRNLRRAKGWTISDLANRIYDQGISVSLPHLTNCETGRFKPSNKLIHAWALALGLHPDDVWIPEPVQVVQEEEPAA